MSNPTVDQSVHADAFKRLAADVWNEGYYTGVFAGRDAAAVDDQWYKDRLGEKDAKIEKLREWQREACITIRELRAALAEEDTDE